MYERLTKVVRQEGRECVVCANYGTEKCCLHNEETDGCVHCRYFGAILNQLCAFEDIITAQKDQES